MSKPQITAAERLRVLLDAKGWNQTKLSEELDASTAIVSRWLSGERSPSLRMAMKLERLIGLPAEAWLDVTSRRAG